MFASSARCCRSKLWSGAYPGENSMSGPAIVPQMSLFDWTEPPWCERTQDMSGFVLPDSTTTSPPLDEQIPFTFSTAHNEIDFDIQHPDPTPRDFIWEDQSEVVLGEDFNMFDNMNYYSLDTKVVNVLPDTPSTEVEEITRPPTNSSDYAYFMPIDDEKHSLILKSPKVDVKALPVKKPGYFSIFDNEEPLIKEDPELSNCSENKPVFYTKDDMEVAEEVVVIADEDHMLFKFDERPFLFESAPMESPMIIKEEACSNEYSVKKEISHDSEVVSEIDNISLDMEFEEDMMFASSSIASPTTVPRVHPQLHLDIEAAIISSNQLLGEGLPDTPEVLKPVLKPGCGFDLVSFLLANGDTNNNVVNPTNYQRPCVKRLQERRRGKSNLLLSNHKECENDERRNTSPPPSNELSEPTPGPSSVDTVTRRRPARKSAMKLKKLMEEGLLRSSPHSSDDEEYTLPKYRRRQSESSSTSSRRRLNSDSDHSSVCGDGAKYRERRDRNNLSSKLSRLKRKMKTEEKKNELKELETKNARLRKRADELSSLLKRVNAAWLEYCLSLKKEN